MKGHNLDYDAGHTEELEDMHANYESVYEENKREASPDYPDTNSLDYDEGNNTFSKARCPLRHLAVLSCYCTKLALL